MSKFWKYFMFLVWMSYLLVCGVLLFSRGFLLRRQVQPEKSKCIGNLYCENFTSVVGSHLASHDSEVNCVVAHNPLQHLVKEEDLCSNGRAKVIMVVIDALKFDFVSHHKTQDPKPFENRLTVIQDLMLKKPESARLYKFIADPPTTTMQRLKGLTTGSLPTFIDMGSNFASTEINEDNVIDQLISKGKKVVFMGDDTWIGLYPQRFEREYPFPSFNVWDLDTVDDGIRKNLQPEMLKRDWDLLIAHFLGVDHCGHRYGPFHSEMTRKLDEMNEVIRDIIKTMDNDTVLLVLGDHGMTNTGDHGGESEAEVTAALFVYSPLGLLPQSWSPKGSVVRQVDLVPTLAVTLGIPVPFSNIGSVIIDALPEVSALGIVSKPLQNWQFALLSLWSNVRQTMTYIETYASRNNEFSSDKLQSLKKMFNSISNRIKNVVNEEEFRSMARESSDFLASLRVLCEKVWVQFDTFSMTWGLVFSFVVLMAIFLVIEALQGDQLTFAASGTHLMFALVGLVLSAVFSYFLSLVGDVYNPELSFFAATFGSSFIFLAIILAENSNAILAKWGNVSKTKSWSGFFWRLVWLFSLWALVSNSYVMTEGQLLSFFLLSVIAILVYSYRIPLDEVISGGAKQKSGKSCLGWLKNQVHPSRLRVLLVAFAIALILRATHQFWRCRDEEAGCSYIESSNKPLEPRNKGEMSADPHCLVMLLCMGLWVTCTRMWLRSCGNLSGYSATVLFARYVPTVLAVCSGGFLVLQGLPGETRIRLFKPWQLQYLPWTVYCLSGMTVISLILRPLCVFVFINRSQSTSFSVTRSENPIPQLYNQMKQLIGGSKENTNQNEAYPDNNLVVYGLATGYSAAFIVLAIVLVPVMGLLLGVYWSPAIVLCASAAACLLLLISLLRFENALVSVQLLTTSWPAVVCWSLLAQYSFYATGHQATFPSIQWNAAMVGTSGNIASSRFFPGLLVILNTFCSHILMGLMLPLVLIAPLTLRVICPQWTVVSIGDQDLAQGELMIYQREEFSYRSLTTLAARYIFLQGVRSLACMFSATIHARHLMVWAIFAPKFIFEAVSLFVTLPCVLVSFMFVGRISTSINSLLHSLDHGKMKAKRNSEGRS